MDDSSSWSARLSGAMSAAVEPNDRVVGFALSQNIGADCRTEPETAGNPIHTMSEPDIFNFKKSELQSPHDSTSSVTNRSCVSLLSLRRDSDLGGPSGCDPYSARPENVPSREARKEKLQLLRASANPARALIPSPGSVSGGQVVPSSSVMRPCSLSPSAPSPAINIPAPNSLHAGVVSPANESARLLRRVPAPPVDPAAVTAPAVVQALLAAKVAAAVERLRAQQNKCCLQNNFAQAYVCQQELWNLQAEADHLQAQAKYDAFKFGNGHDSHLWATARAGAAGRACAAPEATELRAEPRKAECFVDWQGWYQIPHGNIAAADYCSGLGEPKHCSSASLHTPAKVIFA
eukprot:scaffold107002_cov28-Prasinocladus_malaysianus.AAC.2